MKHVDPKDLMLTMKTILDSGGVIELRKLQTETYEVRIIVGTGKRVISCIRQFPWDYSVEAITLAWARLSGKSW